MPPKEREPESYLVFGKDHANSNPKARKKFKMVRKNTLMRIRPWCNICQQPHVECLIENDKWEFVETVSFPVSI